MLPVYNKLQCLLPFSTRFPPAHVHPHYKNSEWTLNCCRYKNLLRVRQKVLEIPRMRLSNIGKICNRGRLQINNELLLTKMTAVH